VQILRNFRQWHMGADRSWTRVHSLFDGHLRISVKRLAAEITQYDAGVVQHHTGLGARRLHPLPDVAEALGEATRGGVPAARRLWPAATVRPAFDKCAVQARFVCTCTWK
jgi:hypothetical protein